MLEQQRKAVSIVVAVGIAITVTGALLVTSKNNTAAGAGVLVLFFLPFYIYLACLRFCSLRLGRSCIDRVMALQRKQCVSQLTVCLAILFIVFAIEGQTQIINSLLIVVYTMAFYTCWCRISMFSLKIDCFRQRSKQALQRLKWQWHFALVGRLIAAALVTMVTLILPSATSLKLLPSAALLWIFVIQSFAWCYTLRRKRKLMPLLCNIISANLNPTQIAAFNAKQLYLWVLFAATNATSGNTSLLLKCAHLMAYTEVLHSFKSLVFATALFNSVGKGRSVPALLSMTVKFRNGVGFVPCGAPF
jgi:hypothetical protein